MSVDFQSRSSGYFNANVSGISLLGRVNALAGATLSQGLDPLGPRPPFVADGEMCRVNAARIMALSDGQILALLDDPDARMAHGGTPGQFVGWVRDWQAFLTHCGGYDSDPEWRPAAETEELEWTWNRGGECGRCQHFDPCFITSTGSGHCALLPGARVHEHQHCALALTAYTERVVVAPAPLGRR